MKTLSSVMSSSFFCCLLRPHRLETSYLLLLNGSLSLPSLCVEVRKVCEMCNNCSSLSADGKGDHEDVGAWLVSVYVLLERMGGRANRATHKRCWMMQRGATSTVPVLRTVEIDTVDCRCNQQAARRMEAWCLKREKKETPPHAFRPCGVCDWHDVRSVEVLYVVRNTVQHNCVTARRHDLSSQRNKKKPIENSLPNFPATPALLFPATIQFLFVLKLMDFETVFMDVMFFLREKQGT